MEIDFKSNQIRVGVFELETLILRFISSVRYWFAVKVEWRQLECFC